MTKFRYIKLSRSKKIRYLKHVEKNGDYIVFLHGFMSDLEGKKPNQPSSLIKMTEKNYSQRKF